MLNLYLYYKYFGQLMLTFDTLKFIEVMSYDHLELFAIIIAI